MARDDFTTEVREEMRFTRSALHDLRQVNRTLVVAVHENVAVSREIRDTLREMRGEMRAEGREARVALREMRESIRANTEAVLHVLDELRGNGSSEATT